MSKNDEKKKKVIGKDSVVYGNVGDDINVGDGSVVIGATDAYGNTIINQPMAVGRGAKAGPGSIAIGAGAGAGSDVYMLIDRLLQASEVANDETLRREVEKLKSEASKSKPKISVLSSVWNTIKMSANIGGAIGLVQQIGKLLRVG